jgi:hypothetical protein|tara:strand:+ start:506 stop:640 length:135 start_codon:yes stop_codon:yes gene_type:complete
MRSSSEFAVVISLAFDVLHRFFNYQLGEISCVVKKRRTEKKKRH